MAETIKIDIRAYIGDFNWTQAEVNEMRELVVKMYIQAAHRELIELAEKRLNSTRQIYIDSIQIEKENRFQYALTVGEGLPTMIEDGASAFDMKVKMLQSAKAKTGKNGAKYITIPMLFRTSAASTKSSMPGQILPRVIYDLIRNSPSKSRETDTTIVSSINGSQISKTYAPKTKLFELNNKAESYIPKSSIYAGLQRTMNKQTGKSTYNTFRRISDNSDPMSWIHGGIKAYNLMDEAMKNVNLDSAVDKAMDEYFFEHS